MSRMLLDLTAYFEDTRGNRLEDHQITKVNDTGERRIYLRGSHAIARQVEWMLDAKGYRPSRLELRPEDGSKWTHRYSVSRPLTTSARDFFVLMSEVVTLEVPQAILDIAIALDWYKKPDPELDSMSWENTWAGKMVRAGKYVGGAGADQALGGALADVARRHPLLAGADVIVPAPGHDTRRQSFSQRVAEVVAAECGKVTCAPACRAEVRSESKGADSAFDLEGEFSFAVHELQGRVALVIDDVYKSGSTMTALARAAKRAHARAVFGLVGARTLRSK